MTDDTDELEEQPVPSESNCPYCGGEPTEQSQAEHSLSKIGYLHDDINLTCAECEKTWVCGVPIGQSDYFADELWCDSCDKTFGRVHRVAVKGAPDKVKIHMKCPNDDCNNFWINHRVPDEDGIVLTGFPMITGQIEGAEKYGYTTVEKDNEDVPDCGNEGCIIHGDGTVGCPNAEHGV